MLLLKNNFIGDSKFIDSWEIEHDSYNSDDRAWIVDRIMEKFPNFCSVHSVSKKYSGKSIEKQLRRRTSKKSPFCLIYDDVLVTGKSMEDARKNIMDKQLRSEAYIWGVVLFARVKPEGWIYPIFQMW